MKKNIAFFDFDGTVTKKDTMLVFLRSLAGDYQFGLKMLLLGPVFLQLKLGLTSNHRAKELMLRRFIGGMTEVEFTRCCQKFAEKILPSMIRDQALEAIHAHQLDGAEVVIVSASPEYWIKDWCFANGLVLIATRLQVINGKMTGMINGHNCYGPEKVDRIRKEFDLGNYESIFAYGDTKGDKPMLGLAHHAFYKPFRSPRAVI